jgi:hypothetical protein
MVVSMFSGLSVAAFADEAVSDYTNEGSGAAETITADNADGGEEALIEAVYTQEEETEITLLGEEATPLMTEAISLGILRFTAVTDTSIQLNRAQLAELVAGCTYTGNDITAFSVDCPFTDIYEVALGSITYKSILWCYSQGYMMGEDENTFNPAGTVTKGQAAVLLARLLGWKGEAYLGGSSISYSGGTYFYDAVRILLDLGVIITEANNEFHADYNLSGADILLWLVNYKNNEIKYSTLIAAAESYSITAYTNVNLNTLQVKRSQIAELIAGYGYVNGSIPLSDYYASSYFKDLIGSTSMALTTKKAILWSADRGYVSGYGDGTFGPEGIVTKAAAAVLLARLTGLGAYSGSSSISDVPSDSWFYSAVMQLYDLEVLTVNSEGKFNPNAIISGAELLNWLVIMKDKSLSVNTPSESVLLKEADKLGILDYTDINDGTIELKRKNLAELMAGFGYDRKVDLSEYVSNSVFEDLSSLPEITKNAILWCADKGIVRGYTTETFLPEGDITKAEAAVVIAKYIDKNKESYNGDSIISDVEETDWYYSAVMLLYDLGIITLDLDGSFNPEDKLSGVDILQWLVNLKHLYSEVSVSSFEELRAALDNSAVNKVTVTADMEIMESLTINKEVEFLRSLTVNKSTVVLTVASGGRIIANNNVYLNYDAELDVKSGGSIIVDSGSTMELNGQTTVNGTIELYHSHVNDKNGAGLIVNRGLLGNGSIVSNNAPEYTNSAWLSFKTYYEYEVTNEIRKPKLKGSDLGSVTLGGGLYIKDLKSVRVSNTADFYDALTNDDLLAANLDINVAGNITLATDIPDIVNVMHVYIQPGVTVNVAADIVIPDNLLIKLQYDYNNNTHGVISIAAGKLLTSYSDWRKYDNVKFMGIMFDDKVPWDSMFGGLIGRTENNIYREYYYAKDGSSAGMMKEVVNNTGTTDFLAVCGGSTFTLNSNEQLTAGSLYVAGESTFNIDEGAVVNVINKGRKGVIPGYEDGRYEGRDYYFDNSSEAGYVNVGHKSTLNVNGTLNLSTEVTWSNIIAVNADEADRYKGWYAYSGLIDNPDPEIVSKLNASTSSVLVNFSKTELWKGDIEVDGGQLNLGASGSIDARELRIGINSGNSGELNSNCGLNVADPEKLNIDDGVKFSYTENMAIPAMDFYGELTISPNVTINLTGALAVKFGDLKIYGKLVSNDYGVTVENGSIYRMYHNYNETQQFVLGITDGFTADYTAVESDWHLANLLSNNVQVSKLALLFNWCFNENSPFNGSDITINSAVYSPYGIEVYNNHKLNIMGDLYLGKNSYLIADGGSKVKAYDITNGENSFIEARNNAVIQCQNLYNSESGNVYGNNPGQIWITQKAYIGNKEGSIESYDHLSGNVYYTGLAARWVNWDNNNPFVDENNEIMHSISVHKGYFPLMFYYLSFNSDENRWNIIPLEAEDLLLSKTNGGDVSNGCKLLMNYETNQPYDLAYGIYLSELVLLDWDSYKLTYAVPNSDLTYTFNVNVELQKVDYYSAPAYPVEVEAGESVEELYTYDEEADEYTAAEGTAVEGTVYYSFGASMDTWIDQVIYEPGRQSTFYLIYNDNINPYDFSNQYVELDNAENVDIERIYNEDSTVWKVTIKDNVTGNFGLRLAAKIENEFGGYYDHDAWLDIRCVNYEHLVWLHGGAMEGNPPRFYESSTNEGMTAGDWRYGAFYLYTYVENEEGTDGSWVYLPVGTSNLAFLDSNGNPVNSEDYSFFEDNNENRQGFYNLTFWKPGKYTVKYRDGEYISNYGVNYDVVDLPDLGTYTSDEAVKDNYISNNSVDYSKRKTFYIVPANGKSLEGMSLSNTKISTNINGDNDWRDLDYNEQTHTYTYNNAFTVTAVDADNDQTYDYFMVNVTMNPFTGNVNLQFRIRNEDNNEFLYTDVNLYSSADRAGTVSGWGELYLNAKLGLNGLTMGNVRYYELPVTASQENPAFYTFTVSTEVKDGTKGDVGLYVFDSEWNMLGEGRKNYVDTNNTMRCPYVFEKNGPFYVAVYNYNASIGDDLKIEAVKSYQPEMPDNTTAKLSLTDDNVYSIVLNAAYDVKLDEYISNYRIYAYINGEWKEKDNRNIWYDENWGKYNTEYCYLADLLENGETAEKFGVRAVNKDGISSEMYELIPDHPITRNDGAFILSESNLKAVRLPNGDVEISKVNTSASLALGFAPSSANRLFFYELNNNEYKRTAELHFGNGWNTKTLRTNYPEDITGYTNGYWEYLVSGQMLVNDVYTVGWNTAAKDYVGNATGDEIGSIDISTIDSWIVRDWDLSSETRFIYNYDMRDWYTFNGGRFWLGTYNAETKECSYIEILDETKFSSSIDIGLKYKQDRQEWEYSLLGRPAGFTFDLIYQKDDNKAYTLTVTVIQPDISFYKTATASNDSLIVSDISSNLSEFYFILSDSFIKDQNYNGIEVKVYKQVQYEEGSGLTYYYNNKATDGRYRVIDTNFKPEEDACFIEDSSLIADDFSGAPSGIYKLINTAHKGDFDVTITVKRNGEEIQYISKQVKTPDIYGLEVLESDEVVIDYYLDSTYSGSQLIFASYQNEKMLGTRVISLNPELLGNNKFVVENLPRGDEYKVFVLSGDGKFAPLLYKTKAFSTAVIN